MPRSAAVPKRPVHNPGKEERSRDAARAVQDYQTAKRVIDAKTARLRALRLTKEAADALEKKSLKAARRHH